MNAGLTKRVLDHSAQSRTRQGIVTAAALVIVVAGMRAAATLLLPLLVSTFIALICAPALFWLKRRGLPSVLSVLVVVLGLLVIGVLVVMLVGSSLGDFYEALPLYQERLQGQVTAVAGWLQNQGLELPGGVISNFIAPGAVMQLAATILSNVGGLITKTFVILVTTIFMLLEASTVPVKLRAVIKDPEKSFDRFTTIAENVNRYLAIKTLVSLATGVTVSIWLLILGVDFPVLWGLLAFLLNYIPNIGSIIAALPPTLLALVQIGPGSAVLAAGGYLAINAIFGSGIEPRLMGHRLDLSTLVVFLSLIIWQWVLGPVGMLLSVPLTMTLKIALESNEDTRWIAILLGSGRVVQANEEERRESNLGPEE